MLTVILAADGTSTFFDCGKKGCVVLWAQGFVGAGACHGRGVDEAQGSVCGKHWGMFMGCGVGLRGG
ncbi:MAG TPA: hypothetical protein PLJ27_07390 [Polyangiaceae bacterium]|jgi:hypothetical protein|nr:MAG: hypothetical protein BWY17_00932 [Deltaproteobacteria bacterium ADurb.Bin207]HOT08402.1 hypothetical protein [Polyangiaceae bacterium]HPB94436.1 hypothetical protein [Polyangiaceae bacterium]HPY16313.1 hypothetical protein [Polyangiaceae bacterium]HQF21888.1 hypothetical protein [Polyangiaceae bacterium]